MFVPSSRMQKVIQQELLVNHDCQQSNQEHVVLNEIGHLKTPYHHFLAAGQHLPKSSQAGAPEKVLLAYYRWRPFLLPQLHCSFNFSSVGLLHPGV
jgi:hypothetical protein